MFTAGIGMIQRWASTEQLVGRRLMRGDYVILVRLAYGKDR
jgi:hypothetical protein